LECVRVVCAAETTVVAIVKRYIAGARAYNGVASGGVKLL
jgi:hypothetical protein